MCVLESFKKWLLQESQITIYLTLKLLIIIIGSFAFDSRNKTF